MEREAKHPDIKPHEIIIVLELLIARMINPQRRHFYDHWSATSIGAVAAGTFGEFMKRIRFTYILSNLHFTNNADGRAGADRAWKVRSVIYALQTSFHEDYTTPSITSLDEAMIPLPKRHNPTRQFVANKPHRWGTKPCMTGCAKSSYCLRLEFYCGKTQDRDQIDNVPESIQSVDHNTGLTAVMRNLEAVLPPVCEVYCVGTIQDNRQEFSKAMVEKNRDRPKHLELPLWPLPKTCPTMTSLVWWDRRPVQHLEAGGSRAMERCFFVQ